VDPDIVNDAEAADELRAERAALEQQAAQQVQAAQAADVAKTMSETDTGGANALTDLVAAAGGPEALTGG